MKNYVIIDADTIQKRIEELENTEAADRKDGIEIYKEMYVLKQILSQSTPLIPEIENAFDAGKEGWYQQKENAQGFYVSKFHGKREDYISNLKLDI